MDMSGTCFIVLLVGNGFWVTALFLFTIGFEGQIGD